MAMNKRESMLAWGVGAVAALYAFNIIVIEPFVAQRKKLEELRANDDDEVNKARTLRRQELAARAKWESRRSEGLASDPKEAERQVLGGLKDWAGETGVVIASVRPEYVESKKELREIMLVASASGSSDAMIKFLLKMRNAKFPVRIIEMKLNSRNESDDLALQLKVSTLYLTQEKKDAKKDTSKKVAKE